MVPRCIKRFLITTQFLFIKSTLKNRIDNYEEMNEFPHMSGYNMYDKDIDELYQKLRHQIRIHKQKLFKIKLGL